MKNTRKTLVAVAIGAGMLGGCDGQEPEQTPAAATSPSHDLGSCCAAANDAFTLPHAQPKTGVPAENLLRDQGRLLESLIDHNNRPFEMAALEGKIVLIYAGYPDCRTICINTTDDLPPALDALRAVHPDIADHIVPVFIASHTGYTPQQMKEWGARFSAQDYNTILLTGPDEDLVRVLESFRLWVKGTEHMSKIAVFGPDHKYLGLVQTQMGAERLQADLFGALGLQQPAAAPVPRGP